MPVVVSILTALAVAVALVFAGRLWFDRVQKRRHAEQIGIEVLNTRRWREALDLLVQALATDGLQQTAEVTSAGGAPMAERILMRGGSRILLIYKHGTTYRIAAPALLDAERRRQEAGLDEVMIATLGTVDADAAPQAERMKVTCIDGPAIWAKVRDVIDATTRDGVASEAEARVERPRRLATIAAAVLGLGIVVWGGNLDNLALGSLTDGAPEGPSSQSTAAEAPRRRAPSAEPPSDAALPADATTTAAPDAASQSAVEAPEVEPAADPRAALAKALAALPEIERASWSSGTTLVVSLAPRISIDAGVGKACGLSGDFPTLRDVRLQVESYGDGDVRWRRCL